MYNKTVLIHYDPVKNLLNQEKHGWSLPPAGLFDWAMALIRADSRSD